jgi:hypothetical protein
VKIWGQDLSRRELEGYTGDLRQIADIQLATLDDGMERGTRIAEVRTGSGFDFTVLLDRAMDIGVATYNGIPFAWQSGTGAAHPSRYEPIGLGWLHTFHGGLLALCGLSQVGGAGNPPIDPENGETLGQHGRINNIPAHDIRIERDWGNPDAPWTLRLTGIVEEVSLFGWRLRLERTMIVTVGKPELTIQDTVRNVSGQPAPLMILYHCNFGWPLVSPQSEIISPTTKIKPRDKAAEPGIGTWNKMQTPTPGYAEQVFFHEVEPSSRLQVAAIHNKSLGIGVEVVFDSRTLNYVTEWKQMGFRDYTVGIEPGNCLPIGRVAARQAGQLRILQPDETDIFTVGFRVVTL